MPDGYKFILEEDTGEYFIVLLENSNSTQPEILGNWPNLTNTSQPTLFMPYDNNKNTTSTASTSSSPSSGELFADENTPPLNAKFNLFLNEDNTQARQFQPESSYNTATTDHYVNINNNEPSDSGKGPRPPPFLSQTSVSNILHNLNSEITASAARIATDGSLNLFDNNSFSESWFDTFITSFELLNSTLPAVTQNDQTYAESDFQQQQRFSQQSTTSAEELLAEELIDLNRNQSLLTLNFNQSILSDAENQTYYAPMPLMPHQQYQLHQVQPVDANTSQVVLNELNGTHFISFK
jgi:hypothetical protein